MTNLLSIIISLVILLIIIFVKDIGNRKNIVGNGELYKKYKKYLRFLYTISIIIFFIAIIIDLKTTNYEKTWLSFIAVIIDALSVAIITLPISSSSIFNISLDEEKILSCKNIITTIYDEKLIKQFNKAGIRVIILNNKIKNSKIRMIDEEKYSPKILNKNNLIIKTDNPHFIKRLEDSMLVTRDLDIAYARLISTRGKLDNITRILKYNLLTYLPIILLYFTLIITGFPIFYNILTIMTLKLITTLTSEYVYKKMTNDVDLKERRPLENGRIMGKQELLFYIIVGICALFCYSLPYQYIISSDGTPYLAITILLLTFTFNNIFVTECLYSEAALLKNLIKSLFKIRTLLYLLLMIVFSILINFVHILNTKNVGLHNYLVCIIFGLVPILILEIIKLARFTSTKGVKKRERKNNKKHRRS